LPEIKVGKNESFDRALRRFRRECQRSGILRDLRKHQHYESPSVKRRKKAEAARARNNRRRRRY
jgi:small subunit ribosomal protein S21